MTAPRIGSTLWRVVFFAPMNRRSPNESGPWHEQRSRVEGWVEYFRQRGYPAMLQASSGEIYDAGKLVMKAPALR